MRILVLAGGGIGDVLMTTPMFRAIKEKYPDSLLAVGVDGKTNIDLLFNNKRIDILFDTNDYYHWFKFLSFLRKLKFDYCFHNHCVGGRRFMIIPFMAGIKNRIGFNKKLISKKRGHNLLSVFFTHSIVDVPDTEKRVKKNLDLLKEINIKNNNYDYDLDLNKKAIKNKKLIGIHPGSDNNGKIKRWDIRKFNKLAQIIISELNYKVKFYIGPQDRESIKCIDEGSDIKIVKNKSLIETIEDISSCSYFISNDSGLSHISAALKIPTLVIFGPTTKDEYILPTKFLPVENNNLECRPCWYKSRGKECNYNIDCLKSISVLDVYDGLLALMKKS